MTWIVHRITVPEAQPFDLSKVKSHLRVDFDEDDAAIANMAGTAALEIEHFAQIALLEQTIRLVITEPEVTAVLRLPIGPANQLLSPTVQLDDVAFTDFDLVGGIRPVVLWGTSFAQQTPEKITVEYQAGFGPDASFIPRDLGQAIMDQTALHYDGRAPMSKRELATSPHMARIAARYRGVQV